MPVERAARLEGDLGVILLLVEDEDHARLSSQPGSRDYREWEFTDPGGFVEPSGIKPSRTRAGTGPWFRCERPKPLPFDSDHGMILLPH
jgi:hypothetical protein